jgi:transposase
VLSMDIIAEIRRRHLVSGESISSIARSLNLSRPTVRKHLRTTEEPVYQRQVQPLPKLGHFQSLLESWLKTEQSLPRAQRRTARRLFEGLQVEGYRGAYDSVQRFVKRWQATSRPTATQAFVPLRFAPGEVCQFDWSHEQAEINGMHQPIKVAHFRLAHSRQMFIGGITVRSRLGRIDGRFWYPTTRVSTRKPLSVCSQLVTAWHAETPWRWNIDAYRICA